MQVIWWLGVRSTEDLGFVAQSNGKHARVKSSLVRGEIGYGYTHLRLTCLLSYAGSVKLDIKYDEHLAWLPHKLNSIGVGQ